METQDKIIKALTKSYALNILRTMKGQGLDIINCDGIMFTKEEIEVYLEDG